MSSELQTVRHVTVLDPLPMPVPSGNHAEPFQRAMLRAMLLSAVWNTPAAIRSPL